MKIMKEIYCYFCQLPSYENELGACERCGVK